MVVNSGIFIFTTSNKKNTNVGGNIMRTLLVLISIFILLDGCKTTIKTFATTDKDKIGVKSNKFRGTIFKSSYPQDKLFISSVDSINRFTPTENEIKLAETILKQQIEKLNNPRINQFGKKQYIDKNLNKYFRQYVGFINDKGHKLIHINFYWDKYTLFDRLKGYDDQRRDYTSDFSMVLDGGSHYWNVNVNLTTNKLERLEVNGVA